MHLLMLLKEFLEDINKQKTRAFLTTVAITWGTLAVILLMAFGQGLSFRMQQSLLNAGDRVIRLYEGQTTKKFQGMPIGRRIRLIEEDARILVESIPEIAAVSPQMNKGVRLRNGERSASTHMEGVYPDFEFLRRMYPAEGGRFLNAMDNLEKRRVVFLGGVVAKEVCGEEDPIGKTITIDGIPFTIVGIMPKKMQSAMNNGPDDRRAIIPFSTFQSIYGWRYLGELLIKPARIEETKYIISEIRRIMGRKYKFDPTDERAIGIWDMIEMEKVSARVFMGINIFLGVIGAMTLIIAGIGVANIMYVVAKERTHEIGIKRAIGAKKRHIIFQFVFESLLLAIIGGGVGILLAVGIVKMVWMIPAGSGAMEYLGRPILSHTVVLTSVIILTLIGLTAGVFPARKAANVDPVEALRYE